MAIIEATAAANNRNAIDASYSTYVREMNDYFASGYNDDREVEAHSRQLQAAALEKFDVVRGLNASPRPCHAHARSTHRAIFLHAFQASCPSRCRCEPL